MAECRVGKRDGCAVRTRALAGVLQKWVDRWDREHPDLAAAKRKDGRRIGGGGSDRSRNARGQLIGNDRPGAVTILHERARGDVSTDTIRAILGFETTYTELRTADALVAAAQCPEAFYDGTLEIEANPYASREARASCCGGSLNGSGAAT